MPTPDDLLATGAAAEYAALIRESHAMFMRGVDPDSPEHEALIDRSVAPWGQMTADEQAAARLLSSQLNAELRAAAARNKP